MNAGAARGGVQAQAGLSLRVIGNLGALVRRDRRIGFSSGNHLDAARRKQRTQPHAQRQREALFDLILAQPSARVVAAVGRIQHHHKASLRSGGSRLRGG